MTRPNSTLVLRRTSERLSAGAAAIAATFFMLLTVDVRATEPEATLPSIKVQYSEAAIVTSDGASQLYRKLKTAARKVCGISIDGRLTVGQGIASRDCFEKALADAVRSIDRPMLTSVHTSTGRELG